MGLFKRIIQDLGRRGLKVADKLVDTYYTPPSHPMNPSAIKRAARHLCNHPQVLVCVGSGLSAESGVPTFRGPDGMFNDPDISRLTHVSTFDSDRQEMMQWYQARRNKLDTIAPNPGHHALIELAQTGRYTIATQNVDHLLEAASDEFGARPAIYHLHGSLLDVRCNDCGHAFEDLGLDLGALPKCDRCDGPLRPGVVWFGESLPESALQHSLEAAENADICLIVGTSGLVQPAAALPQVARSNGATLIEINPNASALSDICDILIRDKAGTAMPALLKATKRCA